ncbi:protein kinase domain-containing protein [Archangium sp.]|uniref:protein kinase domain-containing protein n=1 Tax=Archangium sp. TaxID=1872627 RepID=UPI00286A6FE4|nr:hypothetical protein [Archangium sp.]
MEGSTRAPVLPPEAHPRGHATLPHLGGRARGFGTQAPGHRRDDRGLQGRRAARRGGLGIVYKVERGGRYFALKLLLVHELDGRAKREIGILVHLENPCVVRYVGSDFWPDTVNGHPYIVMEFVPGDTLFAFVYGQNPSARKATGILLDTALTLGAVHAAGVFHREHR